MAAVVSSATVQVLGEGLGGCISTVAIVVVVACEIDVFVRCDRPLGSIWSSTPAVLASIDAPAGDVAGAVGGHIEVGGGRVEIGACVRDGIHAVGQAEAGRTLEAVDQVAPSAEDRVKETTIWSLVSLGVSVKTCGVPPPAQGGEVVASVGVIGEGVGAGGRGIKGGSRARASASDGLG